MKYLRLSIVPVLLLVMLFVALGEMGIGRNVFNYLLYSVSPYGEMQYYAFTIIVAIFAFSLSGVFRRSIIEVFPSLSSRLVKFLSYFLIIAFSLASLVIHFVDKFTWF